MHAADTPKVIKIKNLKVFVFRAPISKPVRTSFGVMKDRPALFVKMEDEDGISGWGEIWCNFPNVGAEHRARLFNDAFRALVIHQSFSSPQALYQHLTSKTAVLAIQSGELGPIAQIISGIDLAAWDLCARRANQPLWRYLGGSNPKIKVYASGINPEAPEKVISHLLTQGYNAFKLKVGFNLENDLENLRDIRSVIPSHTLMIDANQAWDLQSAINNIHAMELFNLHWIEEPLRADSSLDQWRALSESCHVTIAAGENMNSQKQFQDAIDSGVFGVLQPDIAKWGGISECRQVIQNILTSKANYCPHYLGAGIGLLASAHLLAASRSSGYLEIDSNDNPLRTLTCGPINDVVDGHISLSERPGIGIEPNMDQLEPFLVNSF
jgi:L-alanine-DL-glutamate epimerase-like enolase superfamily enzyme